MNTGIHNLIQLLPDAALILWFFRSVDPDKRPSGGRIAAALLALAALGR